MLLQEIFLAHSRLGTNPTVRVGLKQILIQGHSFLGVLGFVESSQSQFAFFHD